MYMNLSRSVSDSQALALTCPHNTDSLLYYCNGMSWTRTLLGLKSVLKSLFWAQMDNVASQPSSSGAKVGPTGACALAVKPCAPAAPGS